MKRLSQILIVLAFALVSTSVNAQETKEVTAKGVGIGREDAIQDALRNAIGQAVGVALSSETQVENFMVIKDAVSTNTNGYISSYDVIKEGMKGLNYEADVKALVSLSPLKADIKLLTKQIGGVRFLVMYDSRKTSDKETGNYDYAVEKINSYLSEKSYRYIENSRFKTLMSEAYLMMNKTDTNTMNFVQQLGMMSGAQFIILINKIHINEREGSFGTRNDSQVIIEAKAYDNCTAEGLGSIILKSDWKGSTNDVTSLKDRIGNAVDNNFDNLLETFTKYIADWANNGTPYELRFYHVGTFRDFREMRNKIRTDSDFGGQLEITSVNNYTKLNITFKSLPDDVAFNILDYADMIPAFKEKMLDVMLIYGRQISFAPQNVVVPEIQSAKKSMGM